MSMEVIFSCKARRNSNPKDKPKAYFTCHPGEFLNIVLERFGGYLENAWLWNLLTDDITTDLSDVNNQTDLEHWSNPKASNTLAGKPKPLSDERSAIQILPSKKQAEINYPMFQRAWEKYHRMKTAMPAGSPSPVYQFQFSFQPTTYFSPSVMGTADTIFFSSAFVQQKRIRLRGRITTRYSGLLHSTIGLNYHLPHYGSLKPNSV